MSIHLSYNECETWNISKVLYTGNSGYSDLPVLSNKTICILFEIGDNRHDRPPYHRHPGRRPRRTVQPGPPTPPVAAAERAMSLARLVNLTKTYQMGAGIAVHALRGVDLVIEEGEYLDIEVAPSEFGRIAAQTAKQVVAQRIRAAEREIIFEEFSNRDGDVVTGVVQRREGRTVFVDVGKVEAVLPA